MSQTLLSFMVVLACGPALAGPLTPAEGFNEGANLGSTWTPPAVNGANAVSHLPSDYYGVVPTAVQGLDAAGLYADGVGDLMTPGVQRNSDCMGMIGNPNHKEQLPCDAVKTMNESDKGGFVFSKNDPILTKAKTVRSDPMAILSAAEMEMKVTEMACAPGTSAVPTETEIRICSEAMVATPGSCQPYQDVVIDRFANFKCKQSMNPLEKPSCEKTLDVNVTISQTCVPGTWNPVPFPDPYTQVDYYCDLNPANGKLKLRFTPVNLHGACQIGYAELPKEPFVVAQNTSAVWDSVCDSFGNCSSTYTVSRSVAHFIHHWKGACTVGEAVSYLVGPQGCTNGVCNYSLKVTEMGAGNTSVPNGIFHNTDILQVTSGGPRWGGVINASTNMLEPKKIVTTAQTWINGCVPYEARVQ